MSIAKSFLQRRHAQTGRVFGGPLTPEEKAINDLPRTIDGAPLRWTRPLRGEDAFRESVYVDFEPISVEAPDHDTIVQDYHAWVERNPNTVREYV